MELDAEERKALGQGDADGIVCLTARDLQEKQPHRRLNSAQSKTRAGIIGGVVDAIGEASTRAQGLPAVITTSGRLRASDHRLYLMTKQTQVLGMLKVGVKRLFVLNPRSQMVEIEPLCVLDFYVHESCQRQGLGRRLFDAVLAAEGADPVCMAYDRPSPKLIAFLAKHFGLTKYTPQMNNFVVFHDFFSDPGTKTKRVSAGAVDEAEFDFAPHASSPAPPSPKRANRTVVGGSATSRDMGAPYHSRAASAVSHASSSSFAFSHTSSGFARGGSGGVPSGLPSRTRPSPLGSARRESSDSRVGSSRPGLRVYSGASSNTGSRGGSAGQAWWERRRRTHDTQRQLPQHQSQQQKQKQRVRGRGGLVGPAGGRSRLGAHSHTNVGLGSEGGMSAVGVGVGPRAGKSNSLVHSKATQRIGRHGVQFRGRR